MLSYLLSEMHGRSRFSYLKIREARLNMGFRRCKLSSCCEKKAYTIIFLKFSKFIIENPHEMHLHVFENECINNLNEMHKF